MPAKKMTDEELRESLVRRLHARVDRSAGEDACWPWTGYRLPRGYGVLGSGHSGRTYAHRLALEVSLGRTLEPGEFACHRCDNPPCCNPAHLYAGDAITNGKDILDRERGRKEVCRNGHPRTPENTYVVERRGYIERSCRDCSGYWPSSS